MNQYFTSASCVLPVPLAEIYTFASKERDEESGLSYFGARYYSSDLSIWLSVDPMSDKYPSLSPYVYCANNPVKLVDPEGEEVVNSHEETMKAAQAQVNYWTEKKSQYQKGSDEYNEVDSKLKKAQHTLNRETTNYNKVNQAIDDFRSKMPDEFNQVNNLTKDGEVIDVYVSIKNFGGPGQMGESIINHGDFTIDNSRLGLTGKGVEIHLNGGYFNLGETLAHEFGHVSYEVNNSASYVNWLKKNDHYGEQGYDGHADNDPSGAMAKIWTDRYKNR